MRRGMRQIVAGIVMSLLLGCVQHMDRQPRYEPFAASSFFPDGAAMRPLVPGTVARDEIASGPPVVDRALLETGRTRFETFCAPCHGLAGDADGVIVQHGFPAPPSFHQDRLRAAPEGHYFDVITHGYGVMYPYGARVTSAERWAIIAYIRALQLSRHATLADVPPAERAALAGGSQ